MLCRVVAVSLPAAFFTAINSQYTPPGMEKITVVTDEVRGQILAFSRGLSVLLLFV